MFLSFVFYSVPEWILPCLNKVLPTYLPTCHCWSHALRRNRGSGGSRVDCHCWSHALRCSRGRPLDVQDNGATLYVVIAVVIIIWIDFFNIARDNKSSFTKAAKGSGYDARSTLETNEENKFIDQYIQILTLLFMYLKIGQLISKQTKQNNTSM